MGVSWKKIEEKVVEIHRNKRKGIKLRIVECENRRLCYKCALNHPENNLCKKFDICYWISRRKNIYFRKWNLKKEENV